MKDMKDTDIPNRSSNMEKAEGDRDDEARDQEQMIERRPHAQDPARPENQRTSDATTISNGELAEDNPTLRTEM